MVNGTQPRLPVLFLILGLSLLMGCEGWRARTFPGPLSSPRAFTIASIEGRNENLNAALIAVYDWSDARTGSVIANSGHRTIYSGTVKVQAHDVLRIYGHVGLTNDSTSPIGASIRTLVNGAELGSTSGENVEPCNGCTGTHHLPLYTDAKYVAAAAGNVEIQIQIIAFRSDGNPELVVNTAGNTSGGGNYGHLVVEHYRKFADKDAASAAGAYLLSSASEALHPLIQFFGSPTAFVSSSAYSLSLAVQPNDLLILLGQATGQYSTKLDMQGQVITADGAVISPWSTENFTMDVQATPMFSQAVHRPSSQGSPTYELKLHSALGIGGSVLSNGGHLLALRYVPSAASDAKYVLNGIYDSASRIVSSITANANPTSVAAALVSATAGAVLKATGYIQFIYPQGESGGIACASQLRVYDAAGTLIDTSSMTYKYITANLGYLSLRTEILAHPAAAGTYSVQTVGWCFYQNGNPVLTLGHSSVLAESYAEAEIANTTGQGTGGTVTPAGSSDSSGSTGSSNASRSSDSTGSSGSTSPVVTSGQGSCAGACAWVTESSLDVRCQYPSEYPSGQQLSGNCRDNGATNTYEWASGQGSCAGGTLVRQRVVQRCKPVANSSSASPSPSPAPVPALSEPSPTYHWVTVSDTAIACQYMSQGPEGMQKSGACAVENEINEYQWGTGVQGDCNAPTFLRNKVIQKCVRD
ncbi:MAG: hypothetical protein AB7G93_18305 [Bdellovibrionales bacterium]